MNKNFGVIGLIFILVFTAILGFIWQFIEVIGGSGSPELFLIISIIAVISFITLIASSEERRNMFIAILSNKRSSSDYNIDLKDNFSDQILREIVGAKSEVFTLGGLPSKFITPQSLNTFARALQTNPKLHLYIYFESEDNVNGRSLYLLHPLNSEDHRSIRSLKQKHQDYKHLKDDIISYVTKDYQASVSSRIHIGEIYLPLYMTITKIDDVIYWTPVSHRRGSRGVSLRLSDKTDPLYELAKEYLEYMQTGYGSQFCVAPNEEIVPVYDESGRLFSRLPRKILHHVPLLRHVVYSFIFNLEGKLLIQKRGQLAHDNRGLWDKSFGGHVTIDDSSSIEAFRRELKEELIGNSLSSPDLVFIGDVPSEGRLKAALEEINEQRWIIFYKGAMVNYISQRVLPTGETELHKQIVDIYCGICPETAPLSPRIGVVEDLKWVDIQDLNNTIPTTRDTYTADLAQLFGTDIKSYQEFKRISDMIHKANAL